MRDEGRWHSIRAGKEPSLWGAEWAGEETGLVSSLYQGAGTLVGCLLSHFSPCSLGLIEFYTGSEDSVAVIAHS